MPKPPNYKQNKKRREDEQKRRNAQEQKRISGRKDAPLAPTDPQADNTGVAPTKPVVS
jgi:hypothetical protein